MTELTAERTGEAGKITSAEPPRHQAESNAEERRVQDALENEEVRENLKRLHALGALTISRGRRAKH